MNKSWAANGPGASPGCGPALSGGARADAVIVEPSWSFARVRVSRGEGMAPGAARLVLQGVYEGSDEATIAATLSAHILEELRQHTLPNGLDEAQPEGARVHVRVTIEWLPGHLGVSEAGGEPASGEA